MKRLGRKEARALYLDIRDFRREAGRTYPVPNSASEPTVPTMRALLCELARGLG